MIGQKGEKNDMCPSGGQEGRREILPNKKNGKKYADRRVKTVVHEQKGEGERAGKWGSSGGGMERKGGRQVGRIAGQVEVGRKRRG